MAILLATDFSDQTKSAMRLAARLARVEGTSLILVHVVDFTGDENAWRILFETPEEVEEHAKEASVQQLEEFYEETVPEDERTEFETVVEFGDPADGIREIAERQEVEMVVLGTIGSSRLQELFLGRTPNRLIRELTTPVVAVPPEWEGGDIRRILAPVDYSDCSRKSLIAAAGLARAHDAELFVLHSFGTPRESPIIGTTFGDLEEEVEQLRRDRLEALETFIEDSGVADQVDEFDVIGARPNEAIRKTAEEGDFDLICMGTHGRRGLKRFFLGSTAERILRKVPCPVMVIRGE